MKKIEIPLWVRIWVFLMAMLSLGFAVVSYINPEFFGAEWAIAGPEKLATVFGHYTGRNISMGVVTLLALAMGRPQGMIIVLSLRVITDLLDTLHQALAGTINIGFVMSAGILFIGCGFALHRLWPLYRAESQTGVANK